MCVCVCKQWVSTRILDEETALRCQMRGVVDLTGRRGEKQRQCDRKEPPLQVPLQSPRWGGKLLAGWGTSTVRQKLTSSNYVLSRYVLPFSEGPCQEDWAN